MSARWIQSLLLCSAALAGPGLSAAAEPAAPVGGLELLVARDGDAWSLRPYWQPEATPTPGVSTQPLRYELLVESVSGPNRLRSRKSGTIAPATAAPGGVKTPLTTLRIQAHAQTRYRAMLTLREGERVVGSQAADF